MTKYILVFGWLWFVRRRFLYLSGYLVKQPRSMPCRFVFLSQAITFPFYGDYVQQLWAIDVLEVFQCLDQFVDIMTVHWSEIPEIQ
jgi:hypothetical protein